jgi:hypothetical protein
MKKRGIELAANRILVPGAQDTRGKICNADCHLESHVSCHNARAGTVTALVRAEVVAAAELLQAK